jgi:hypothetical protein
MASTFSRDLTDQEEADLALAKADLEQHVEEWLEMIGKEAGNKRAQAVADQIQSLPRESQDSAIAEIQKTIDSEKQKVADVQNAQVLP